MRSKAFGTDGSRTTAVQSCQINCDDNTAGCRGWSDTVIAALRRALGARPIQEAVRLFRQLMGLRDMRRQPGESMRKWTSRFEAFIKKTGKALHQADAEIDETTFLHPLIQGILLLECSNLSPAETAVLATSGATTKEGGSIGNSYLYVDLAASFIAQWDDEALMRRDKAPQRRTHHTAAAATTTWDLSSPSNVFLDQDTVDGCELETALGTYDEPWEDQSWEEPEEAEVLDDDWTDELPPEDEELEDQFGSLEAAEAYAVTEFKSASSDMRNATRTFMEAKDLVSRVKHARGYFPVVDVGAFDGFQTITPRGSRQTGAGKGASTGKNSQASNSRRPSPAKSRVTSTGAAKGGPAHGTRIQPGQCLLCRQMRHLARDCPNRGTRDDSGINLKRAFGSFVGMTGDRDVSSLVLTTTPQQEIVQYSDFNMSHVPVAIWDVRMEQHRGCLVIHSQMDRDADRKMVARDRGVSKIADDLYLKSKVPSFRHRIIDDEGTVSSRERANHAVQWGCAGSKACGKMERTTAVRPGWPSEKIRSNTLKRPSSGSLILKSPIKMTSPGG